MSKHTLKLAKKPAFDPKCPNVNSTDFGQRVVDALNQTVREGPAIVVPTDEQIQEYLNKQRAAKSGDSSFDWKYDAPVESKPFDPATIPAHARTIPVQAPSKTWGNPRYTP